MKLRQVLYAALSLSLEDVKADVQEGQDQEEDECPLCLLPFGDDDDDDNGGGEAEVLGCEHRYHDSCIDRWLCKCNERACCPPAPCAGPRC